LDADVSLHSNTLLLWLKNIIHDPNTLTFFILATFMPPLTIAVVGWFLFLLLLIYTACLSLFFLSTVVPPRHTRSVAIVTNIHIVPVPVPVLVDGSVAADAAIGIANSFRTTSSCSDHNFLVLSCIGNGVGIDLLIAVFIIPLASWCGPGGSGKPSTKNAHPLPQAGFFFVFLVAGCCRCSPSSPLLSFGFRFLTLAERPLADGAGSDLVGPFLDTEPTYHVFAAIHSADKLELCYIDEADAAFVVHFFLEALLVAIVAFGPFQRGLFVRHLADRAILSI